MTNRRKNGSHPSDPTADGAPESLDKVRDILFGGQMRLVESRLQGLEERIQQEQKSLRAEQAKRAEELKALVVEVKDSLRNLEKRHAKLEESAGLADAELRDQVLQHSSAISGEMAQLSSRLSSELARSVTELADDKVDTTVLAELLAGLSASLSGEGRRATKKASRS